jgi:hypothetical protein
MGPCFAAKAAPPGPRAEYRAAMSGSQPPGWYPAPGSPTVERWWDGIRWTGEVRETDQPGAAPALTAKFADGPTAPAATQGASATGPVPADSSATASGTGGWTISWPGTGPMPARPPKKAKQAKQAKQAAAPVPEPEAQPEAAWRAPAVEAWEARTSPESGRRFLRRGKTKRD